jgi:hypothetical protein
MFMHLFLAQACFELPWLTWLWQLASKGLQLACNDSGDHHWCCAVHNSSRLLGCPALLLT